MLLSLFPHLCFKVAPCSLLSLIYCASKQHHVFHIVSLISCLVHTSGNFSLQNLACIFLQWASSNSLGLCEQASWMHTHQFSFVEHSQLQCIRCMAIPTPYVDINLWASPQPVDQPRQRETFSFFVFSTQSPSSYSIPPIVLYPWLALIYCESLQV